MVGRSFFSVSPIVRSRSLASLHLENGQGVIRPEEVNRLRGINTRIWPTIEIGGGRPLIRQYSVAHANNLYNPVTKDVQARYSENEWSFANENAVMSSLRERADAEQFRIEAWQTVRNADQHTRSRQMDATSRLKERSQDIDYWRHEVNREIKNMEYEQELLKEQCRVFELALAHTNKPLSIAEECLLHRDKRIGIDLVKDAVERALIKEVELIKKFQQQMQQLLEKGHIQAKLNRACQHELEKDEKDKNHAYAIDSRLYQLSQTSGDLGLYPGIELVDKTITTPTSWMRFTKDNIARSQRQRIASERIRNGIDNFLRSVASSIHGRFAIVNNALSTRIQEIRDAKDKLENSLKKTKREIFDIEEAIELINKSLADKLPPLRLAETRLEERVRRTNVENCQDTSMEALQREVNEIRSAIRLLKDKIHQAESALARLQRVRSQLETEIAIKENSLNIDQNLCLGMRKTFPTENKRDTIFSIPVVY